MRVQAGRVTLSRAVDRQFQRRAAIDSVRRLLGVTGVSDQIGIKRTSIGDSARIAVAVHGSDVTLSRSVHSRDECDTATHSAWATPGVRHVIDLMTLTC